MSRPISAWRPALLVTMLALLASPASASRSALQRVTVIAGGHPVVATGAAAPAPHLFAQHFDSHCRLVSERAGTTSPLLAATVADQIELEVALQRCPDTSPQPTVTCDWEITRSSLLDDPSCGAFDAAPDPAPTTGRSSGENVTITAPAQTGIYDLALRCTAGETALQPLDFRLYATYGTPLFAFSPPRQAWYEKATCWGAGLSTDNTEANVLAGLQSGIYHYGANHWRYGYAQCKDDGTLIFPGADNERYTFNSDRTSCDNHDRVRCGRKGRCACFWQELVEGSHCNFSDCYEFSYTLQSMAATLGVDSLARCDRCVINGAHQKGFLITPDTPSFDAAFPRGLLCDERTETCPHTYYFGKHSLVWHDGISYDATFNARYLDPDRHIDPVGLAFNPYPDLPGLLATKETVFYTRAEPNYGTWRFYGLLLDLRQSTDLTTDAAATTAPSPALPFQVEDFQFQPIDLDTDRVADALEARLEVVVRKTGRYTFYGQLYKDDVLITERPDGTTSLFTQSVLTGKAGEKHVVKLDFSGEDIYRAKHNGPYTLGGHIVDLDEDERHPLSAPYAKRGRRLRYKLFGEQNALIETVRTTWIEEENGLTLQIEVDLRLRQPGPFILHYRLAQEGASLAQGGTRCDDLCQPNKNFRTLRVTVPLAIPADGLRDEGARGPYLLTVGLFDEAPRLVPLDGWIEPDLPGPAG